MPARFESTPLDVAADKCAGAGAGGEHPPQGDGRGRARGRGAIRLAYKARMPDTSVGFMADAKMSPVLYRPWGTVSIPLWRDKLAAQVAEAQANKRAGEARLSAEQIGAGGGRGRTSLRVSRDDAQPELLQKALLPKQRQSLEVARSAYLAGQVDFLNLTEAEQTLLRFNLDEVEARTQRELSLAELSLIMPGHAAVRRRSRRHGDIARRAWRPGCAAANDGRRGVLRRHGFERWQHAARELGTAAEEDEPGRDEPMS